MAQRFWPLAQGFVVTSPFGPRDGGFHAGTDFGRVGGSAGEPVYAVQAGSVIHSGAASGYGGPDPAGWLVIDSDDEQGGGCVEYGHIVREVAPGARVAAGQRIAHINPDTATNGGVAPHLHLSVMPGGYDPSTKFDAVPWLREASYPRRNLMASPIAREFDQTGVSPNCQGRSGTRPIWFLLHTQEGAGNAQSLAAYLQKPSSEVSYHYTVDGTGNVVDVVDTDLASWSVMDANNRSVNLCFAGSRASWTRSQWLDNMRRGIECAAWLAVQDCRKYGIPIRTISPAAVGRGVPGIADHNAVTVGLGIGSHTDCGPGFPWDFFVSRLGEYSTAPTRPREDEMTPEQAQMLAEIHRELTQRYPSRSRYRDSDDPVDTLAGYTLNVDARIHEAYVETEAGKGLEWAIALVRREADKGDSAARALLEDLTTRVNR